MKKEVFKFRVATPTYVTCPMSLYKARQERSLTAFPAGAQIGLLCLLVCGRVFFSYWCAKGSSFPAVA